jgi:hypothetical protein
LLRNLAIGNINGDLRKLARWIAKQLFQSSICSSIDGDVNGQMNNDDAVSGDLILRRYQ